MKLSINKIKLHERQRKDLGDLESLANSLRDLGQINPVLLEETTNLLLAGERRFRAAQMLGWTELDVAYKGSLTPAQKKRIELEENTHRKDLNWKERCLALADLHHLCRMDAHAAGHEWYKEHTSALAGFSVGTVTYNVQLADEIRREPEGPVANAENYVAAIQVLAGRRADEARAELDKRNATSVNITPGFEQETTPGTALEAQPDAPPTIYLSNMAYNEDFCTVSKREFPDDMFHCAMCFDIIKADAAELNRILKPGSFWINWTLGGHGLKFILSTPNIIWNLVEQPASDGWPFPFNPFMFAQVYCKGTPNCLTPSPSAIIHAPVGESFIPYQVVEFALQNIVAPPHSVLLPNGGPVVAIAQMGLRPMFFESDKVLFDEMVAALKEHYLIINPDTIFK